MSEMKCPRCGQDAVPNGAGEPICVGDVLTHYNNLSPTPPSPADQIKEAWKEGWNSGAIFERSQMKITDSDSSPDQSLVDQFFTHLLNGEVMVESWKQGWRFVIDQPKEGN